MASILPLRLHETPTGAHVQNWLCRFPSPLLPAVALVLASAPEGAAAQVRSNLATVQLTVTALPGASFRPAAATVGVVGSASSGIGSIGSGLAVNAPYRLQVRRPAVSSSSPKGLGPLRVRTTDGREHELSPGSTITLVAEGRPGPVQLQMVSEVLEGAGVLGGAVPLTVDVVLDASL